MRKTSCCKLSTILCLVFLHVIFCISASYAVGTDPTEERREETAPNLTDMPQNERAREIIALLEESRRLDGQLFIEAQELIRNPTVDPVYRARLAILIFEIMLESERGLTGLTRAQQVQDELFRRMREIITFNIGVDLDEQTRLTIQIYEALLVNQHLDPNERARLATQIIELGFFGPHDQLVGLLQIVFRILVDPEVGPNERARLTIRIFEVMLDRRGFFYTHNQQNEFLTYDQLVGLLQGMFRILVDPHVDLNERARLAIQIYEVLLVDPDVDPNLQTDLIEQIRNQNLHQDLNLQAALRELLVDPDADPTQRIRLASRVLSRAPLNPNNQERFQYLQTALRELLVNQHVAPNRRLMLALLMQQHGLELGQALDVVRALLVPGATNINMHIRQQAERAFPHVEERGGIGAMMGRLIGGLLPTFCSIQ